MCADVENIEREPEIILTKESTETIADLLENPPEYNDRMQTAMRRARTNDGFKLTRKTGKTP